jgi:UPF0271 protein
LTKKIDINVDVGEGFGIEQFVLPFVSSVNIACGGHAGSKLTMQETVLLAKQFNVRIGAHPSFEDKKNFGRLILNISQSKLKESIIKQVQSLVLIAKSNNLEVEYIKPHGALYHLICNNLLFAQMMLEVIKDNFPSCKLMGLPNCLLRMLAEQNNVDYIAEGFADRVYEEDGNLRDRKFVDSVWKETSQSIRQVLNLLDNTVITYSGNKIKLDIQSICFHGDQVDAVKLIKFSTEKLKEIGVEVRS